MFLPFEERENERRAHQQQVGFGAGCGIMQQPKKTSVVGCANANLHCCGGGGACGCWQQMS